VSAVERWMTDGVRAQLVAAAQINDTISVDRLREEVGIGHADLSATLDLLREEGAAVEEAPGEWTARQAERSRVDDDVDARAQELLDRFDGKTPGEMSPAELEEPARAAPARGVRVRPDAGEVVLTMAVASALDAETIGKLVEAGIAEAKEAHREFVLRVMP
jgi:biotin operon repressor